MTEISSQKADARTLAFAARKQAHLNGGDDAACQRLSGYLAGLPPFRIIAAYMPIRTEISPLAVMAQLHAQGKTVAVPVIAGNNMPLKFSVWTPDTSMIPGPFGAAVPQNETLVDPDVLITPLVAFDRRGYRLGYGGGFYDRSFQALRLIKPVLGIGLAYAAQELPSVPREPTDQRLDAIVTEREILRVRP